MRTFFNSSLVSVGLLTAYLNNDDGDQNNSECNVLRPIKRHNLRNYTGDISVVYGEELD